VLAVVAEDVVSIELVTAVVVCVVVAVVEGPVPSASVDAVTEVVDFPVAAVFAAG